MITTAIEQLGSFIAQFSAEATVDGGEGGKKQEVRENEEKKESHEDNGYWYTWVENPEAGCKRGWNCVPISEKKQEVERVFWDFGSSSIGDEFEYHSCDD